jgi:hypothetical protein
MDPAALPAAALKAAGDRFLRPAWASEITNFTPERPRSLSRRRKAVRKVSSSLSSTSMPSTSRWPLAVMPTATITALEINCLRA